MDDHAIPQAWSVFCFYSGAWLLSSPPIVSLVHSCADTREALLCALTSEAELGCDCRPGCSGLAGFGGACLLVGGGNPAQVAERRTGW